MRLSMPPPLRRLGLSGCLILIIVLSRTTGTIAQSSSGMESGGGGAKNVVVLVNTIDGRLRTSGNVQVNRIPGPSVEPVNQAMAQASCTDCQSLAVAFQINLISRTATRITPENAAVAVNYSCTRCYTVARAIQYVYQVDDPTVVPPEVSALAREMNRELDRIQTDRNITLSAAEARIDAVIAKFHDLAASLDNRRSEAIGPTSPTGTPCAEPCTTSPTPGVAFSATPTSVEWTATPETTASPTPSSTMSVVAETPQAASTLTPTPMATATSVVSPTSIPSLTAASTQATAS